MTVYNSVLIQPFTKKVFTRKKEKSAEKQLGQLNETLNDFIIGNGFNVSAMENETLEQHNNGQHNNLERFFDSASQNQVIENNIDDKIRRGVNDAVLIVENRMHDAILIAMDKVVIPRVEMDVKSITGSSRYEPNSEVLYPDRGFFLRKAGNTPLMSATSRLDLKSIQDRNDEIRNEKNFEDGDFPALRSNHDRRLQVHHSIKITSFVNFYSIEPNEYQNHAQKSMFIKLASSSARMQNS